MLWLCLHFPELPLQLLARSGAVGPLAVTVGKGTRRSVYQANAEALAGGVRPGLAVSAALALVPELLLRGREESAEAAALEGLAAWAYQFSSQVSLSAEPFPALLLEAQGSLALFGGGAALREAVRRGLEGLGYRARYDYVYRYPAAP